jgi:hypothetical protein
MRRSCSTGKFSTKATANKRYKPRIKVRTLTRATTIGHSRNVRQVCATAMSVASGPRSNAVCAVCCQR